MNMVDRVLQFADRELKITKKEFCTLISESPQNLNNWKNRGTIPSDKLVKVSMVLDKSTDWILTGKDHLDTDSQLLSQLQVNYTKAKPTTRYAVNMILNPPENMNETILHLVNAIASLKE